VQFGSWSRATAPVFSAAMSCSRAGRLCSEPLAASTCSTVCQTGAFGFWPSSASSVSRSSATNLAVVRSRVGAMAAVRWTPLRRSSLQQQ
jgi:hypothetical protein